MGHKQTIANESWPKFDEAKTILNTIEIPIQVNGKLRAKVTVARAASEEEIKEKAFAEVKDYIQNGVKKVIYIPGRIFNIVV